MTSRPLAASWLVLFPWMAAAQTPSRALLSSATLQVEARSVGGRLEERYLAIEGQTWRELAVAAGETIGPVTVKDPSGVLRQASVLSLSATPTELTEILQVGSMHIRRTIRLTTRDHWLRVTTRLEEGLPAILHSFSDRMQASFQPDWSYSPSVGGFNPDAQYKAPLILAQGGGRAFGVVPDVLVLTRDDLKRCNHAMDLDVFEKPLFSVGYIPARQAYHSVYRQDLDRNWAPGRRLENSYYLYLSASAPPKEAFREAVRFHWSQFGGAELDRAAAAQSGTDAGYKECGLFDEWRRVVWDEESPRTWLSLTLPDGSTGGGVRTLRWGQPSPSVYLSSWFNSLRTAFGMALYARRTGKPELMEFAQQTVRLALKAPGREGAFKCIAVRRENGEVSWAAGDGSGASVANGYLGFDMSWTAYWLLRWREAGLPDVEGITERAARLADFLIARQRPDGMLPSRFDENGAVEWDLSNTVMAETAPAALLLFELYKTSPKPEYLRAARGAMRFLEREVIPERKWYDYETFWSCSPRFINFDSRTRQWPANNLALIHAVAAYLAAFETTHEAPYLDKGQALLDYLLLYQQSWTNPALEQLSGPAMLLGGFTTQNSDAEWSDARQSLAGSVLMDYYRATGKIEYLERGVEALRAQFPISPSENWAHTGFGRKAGVSSFHWGTGSGMAGIEMDHDYLRDAVFDVVAGRGVGVNGLNLTGAETHGNSIQFRLESPFRWSRNPTVVFRHAQPGQLYQLSVNGASIGRFTGKELESGVAVPAPGVSSPPPGR